MLFRVDDVQDKVFKLSRKARFNGETFFGVTDAHSVGVPNKRDASEIKPLGDQ